MSPLLAGLLAGSLHVVSGPDHLAAVAPLAVRRPGVGFRVGTLWGLGHASGALAVGALGVFGRSFVDVQALSSHAELAVGFILAGIGAWALLQSRKVVLHRHEHDHPDEGASSLASHGHPHEHLHLHEVQAPHTQAAHQHHGGGSAFGVGLVHGAAGTGHLLGVLPALALPTHSAIVYLLAYGFAAIAAMASFGAMMGTLGGRLKPGGLRLAIAGAGAAAIAVGIFWIVTGWPRG